MANKQRGEVEIRLGGETLVLRPTFHALCEIESKAGAGLITIAKKLRNSEAGLKEITAIIWAGMKGADINKYSFEQAGEEVVREGLTVLMPIAAEFLAAALSGGSHE